MGHAVNEDGKAVAQQFICDDQEHAHVQITQVWLEHLNIHARIYYCRGCNCTWNQPA